MANLSLRQRITKNFSNYRWLLHLLFWCVMVGASILQSYYAGRFANFGTPVGHVTLQLFVMKFLTLLLVCYSFQFLIMPLYRYRKQYIFWSALVVLLIFAFLLQIILIKMISIELPLEATERQLSLMNLIGNNLTRFLLVFFFFTSFYYFVDIYDQQKELRRLSSFKTQKISLESNFLKSQVNPHFLFNTLNNIYALSLKKSDQTQVVIERLESLLHYMLYECKEDLVPLENEFRFTNSYIALEQLRHKQEECTVTVNITGDTRHKTIAPLLLINFLENAFKHGTKSSFGKSWINMEVKVDDRCLHFRLQNSKPFRPNAQPITEYKGGIGIKNVKRRLEILYPAKHRLNINNLKDRFEIDLLINF